MMPDLLEEVKRAAKVWGWAAKATYKEHSKNSERPSKLAFLKPRFCPRCAQLMTQRFRCRQP